MIDVGLAAKARKAVDSKPRSFITPEVLCAFVMQESHGVPYFVDTKPGSIYRLNVAAAITYKVKNRVTGEVSKLQTGLTEKDIREIITIPDKVGSFDVPAVMRGKLAKFRFEPGYWRRYSTLARRDRFIYASSWGLVQFMGPNISPKPDAAGIDFIKRFMADVDLQLLYAAGMIDDLMIRGSKLQPDAAIKDLPKEEQLVHRAYRGYNSGKVSSDKPEVIARATNVLKFYRDAKRSI